jgi:hypothetical protein
MTKSMASTAGEARGRSDDTSHRQYRCKKTLHDRIPFSAQFAFEGDLITQ